MNSNVKYMIVLIIGIGLGLLISQSSRNHAAHVKPRPAGPEIVSPEEPVKVVDAEKFSMGSSSDAVAENPSIAQVETSVEAQQETKVDSSDKPSNHLRKLAAHIAKQMPKKQYEAELTKLVTVLDLNPSQVDAFEEYYKQMEEQQVAMTQQIFDGKSIKSLQEEMIARGSKGQLPNLNQVLKEQLSPEQAKTYKEFKAQEKIEKKEAKVLGELAKIQSAVTMSGEQKDEVYALLHEQAYKLKPEEIEALENKPGTMGYALEIKEKEDLRLLESMSGILTMDQLEVFERQQDKEQSMLKMASGMMGNILKE